MRLFRPKEMASEKGRLQPRLRHNLWKAFLDGTTIDRLAILLSGTLLSGFGWRPGLVGSFAGALWAYLAGRHPVNLLVFAIYLVVGYFAVARTIRLARGDDPSPINLDEVAGAFVAGILSPHWWPLQCVALALFVYFDRLKPYPANRFDSGKDAFSVVADDVVCGVYAGGLVLLASLLLNRG